MSPLIIRALFEIHSFPYKEQLNDAKSDAILSELLSYKLIEPDPRSCPEERTVGCTPHDLQLTNRGRVYTDALQELPLPEQRWIMPQLGELHERR